MPDKFAIIGLGQFGFAIAKKLAARGAEVLAIDQDPEIVELIKDDIAYAVTLDSTDLKALSAQNITDMDAVLIAIGENIEGLLLTTVLLLELKVKRIIARAMSEQQRIILDKLGVKEIISPEEEVAHIVVERLINPNMRSVLPLPDAHEIAEVNVPRRIVGKTIDELAFDDIYQIHLICIKRIYEEYNDGKKIYVPHLIKRPKRDTILQSSDMLIVLGKGTDVDKFLEVNR